jgi:hypothetical protein
VATNPLTPAVIDFSCLEGVAVWAMSEYDTIKTIKIIELNNFKIINLKNEKKYTQK